MRVSILFLVVYQSVIIYSMELKGNNACQTPLLINGKISTSSNNERLSMSFNNWCPLTTDLDPYFQVTLGNLTFITALEIRSSLSSLDYRLEYTREAIIDQNTMWRSYRALNNEQERIQLESPMIARHVRLTLKNLKKSLCLEFELFGCLFTDGVVSYNMLQGSHQLEDDTYDGHYDEKQHYLYDGLGQLSDGQTGPDNREDVGGHQWVGWRKPRSIKTNHSITILFNFDSLRNFSRLTIHANNYFPKNIFIFRSATIEFLSSTSTDRNEINNSSLITYQHQHDDQFEMARAIMIDLKHHVASQLKIRLHFDGHWILISEMTFDSFVIPSQTKETQNKGFIGEQIVLTPSSNEHFWFYALVCVATMIIILMLAAIVILIRRTLNDHKKLRKHYFTPIHNHTHSSASTTSSDIDFNTSQHRYATIGPAPTSTTHQPYLLCANNSVSSSHSPHYAKLMPTATLLRAPSLIQQNHIQGVCGNSSYTTQRAMNFDLNQNQFIPSKQIVIKRKIDSRQQLIVGGEIYQGEFQVNQSIVPITIRRLLPNTSIQSKISFFNEISLLSSLCHPNILHAYGFCSEPSMSLVTESLDSTSIDLYQYLQHYKQEQQMGDSLYATVVFFGSQISSALAYLESLHIQHRDIAARNCLVTLDLTIKLQDLAMANETYADDYVVVNVGNDVESRRPIRWCAWETICLNQFSSKSDVFSFGVLLWEILTMAERPHALLDDEQVLKNLQNADHSLVIPASGFDLAPIISSCWNKCDYDRPSFSQLNHLLCQKQQFITQQSEHYQTTNSIK